VGVMSRLGDGGLFPMTGDGSAEGGAGFVVFCLGARGKIREHPLLSGTKVCLECVR